MPSGPQTTPRVVPPPQLVPAALPPMLMVRARLSLSPGKGRSGFGQSGPLVGRPAMDPVLQALDALCLCTRLKDLRFLAQVAPLRRFSLWRCGLKELEGIDVQSGIEELELVASGAKDLAQLRALSRLRCLTLQDHRGLKDMRPLAELASHCDPSTKVVVIGHYNDVWLYRELIRSGVSEYVVAPISMADIVSVIASIFVDPEAEPIGRSIAFIGAKGGVGSSTIAHNVAWTMSKLFASEVVVADLDLPFGTANINFDQDPAQGIAEAVFAPERVDEVYLDRLLAQEQSPAALSQQQPALA